MNLSDSQRAALEAVISIPRDAEGPVFREPWEAQAFAMAVHLHERGVFTWAEWAETLGAEIAAAGSTDTGEDYYLHWMSALERLSRQHGLMTAAELSERKSAWDRAARATPHGEPIELGRERET